MKEKTLTILAIETSCDDTCIAILKANKEKIEILSNVVSSQIKIHQKYGGVYPTLAKREHQKNLVPLLKTALKKANLFVKSKNQIPKTKAKVLKKILKREEHLFNQLKVLAENCKKPKIDLIAITIGPGLDPCLWTGINFAKSLAYLWNLAIVPVNHIEAHIFSGLLTKSELIPLTRFSEIKFPAIVLVVSGGHTQLILIRKFGDYKILGETKDDAGGECLDKTARILGLPYPGGPAIEKLASSPLPNKNKDNQKQSSIEKLPRPMFFSKDYDFSFAGLKTAVLYRDKKTKNKNKKYKIEMAREIQQAIIDVLLKKTLKAVLDYNAKTIILGGGVVANKKLREEFKKAVKKKFKNVVCIIPEKKYCTDNGVMVGLAGYFHRKEKTKDINKIQSKPNLTIS